MSLTSALFGASPAAKLTSKRKDAGAAVPAADPQAVAKLFTTAVPAKKLDLKTPSTTKKTTSAPVELFALAKPAVAAAAPKVVPVLKEGARGRIQATKTAAKLGRKAQRRAHLSHKVTPITVDEAKRTIFVGNLPNKTTMRELHHLFRNCGEVESTRIRGQKLTEQQPEDKQRGRAIRILRGELADDPNATACGYVVFRSAPDVFNALKLNGSVFKEHHLTVAREDPGGKFYDPKNSVYLGNLAYTVRDEDVWQAFIDNGFSDVSGVRVIRDRETGQARGVGYVSFKSASSVNKAITQMRGVSICGRELRVCHVQKSKDARVQGPSRREKRQLQQANQPSSSNDDPYAPQREGDEDQFRKKRRTEGEHAGPKTSLRRQVGHALGSVGGGGGTQEEAPAWMGTVTNPRRKVPKDLRHLVDPGAKRKPKSGGKTSKAPAKKKKHDDV